MAELTVALDGIAASHPQPGGYKTYTTNLVQHLATAGGDVAYRLFVDRPLAFSLPPGWSVEVLASGRGGPRTAWREQVALPRRLASGGAALLHSPCATGPLRAPVPVVVTIHDVIEFTDPLPPPSQAKRWAMRVYSRFVQVRLAGQARAVITVSEYSRRQIAARFGLPPERITVVYEAPSAAYRPLHRPAAAAESMARWGAAGHVLALASAAPRKNTAALMAAYALLPAGVRERHPLVLVCSHRSLASALSRRAERAGLERHLRLAEGVTDAQLLCLYNAAALFAFPSAEEGFGLPPLEAMACGTPVVASNASCLPEILSDAALLVDPADTAGLAAAMESVLTSPSLSADLAKRGLAHSSQFSWQRVARETLAVYRDAARREAGLA